MIGTRLAHYDVTSHLGTGGMGEVYQATDSKLGRSVAIKLLPAAFATDADRLSRFRREAQLLASLNHTNIAHIYGIEESGETCCIVMELVEGETLQERLKKGPIPLNEAFALGTQIAEALEAAHEKGVIHRDLKPGNVMLTSDEKVKVLDFGLAKAYETHPSSATLANSPTMTGMGVTNTGVILGTAAYMSPEQARGKTVDRRSDIFSFGCVLFEMLTGKPAFEGEDVAEILSAVLKGEPDWNRLPAGTPAAVRNLLRSCLEKNIKNRRSDAADVRLDIAQGMKESRDVAIPDAATAKTSSLAGVVALAALVGLAALSFVHFRENPVVEQRLLFQIPPPGSTAVSYPTIAPDGRQLAFIANAGGEDQVWVRAMDTLELRALAGTEGATYPFWSPDGAYLAFFAQGKLKKIAIAGGPPQTLCDASSGRGGTWNRDNVIVFSAGPGSPLLRVAAAGGVPAAITKFEGDDAGVAGHRFPSFLPDGIHFLYNAGSDKPDNAGIFIGSLDQTSPIRVLPDKSNALYAPPDVPGSPGYLLFQREDVLMAQPFDARSLKTAGDMFPVAEKMASRANVSYGKFSVSLNGSLVYGKGASNRALAWIDRAGKRIEVVGKPASFRGFSMSPDEKTVAVSISSGPQTDIWLQAVMRDVLTRFTFRSGVTSNAVWSPDGNHVAYQSQAGAAYTMDLFQKPVGGNGAEQLLVRGGINASPMDWSSDGKWLVYSQLSDKTGTDLWLLPVNTTSKDAKPISFLQTPFEETNAKFSPDGKWMAYQSNESGRYEIYVQAVTPGAKWQLSTSGGSNAQWRHDGAEIFYMSADRKLTVVPVKLGSTVEPGRAQPLFPIPAGAELYYAPTRDGQRFLMNVPAGLEGAAASPLTVVIHWQSFVKK